MKEVSLSGGDKAAIVDDSDFGLVSKFRWRLRRDGRADSKIGGKMVLIHRYILNAPSDKHVDHINRNPLDCRRENLRLCDPHSNTLNQVGKPNQRVCKYKGVSPKNGMFVAVIDHKYKGGSHYLGSFRTEREAAIAYDIFAERLHGEFALLNLPDADSDERAAVQSIIDSDKPNRRDVTSIFKGVGFHKTIGKWRARLGRKHMGWFKSEQEAASALNK